MSTIEDKTKTKVGRFDTIKFFGILLSSIVGINYLIGSLHNKTLNPLYWDYKSINSCSKFVEYKNGFHYDLNVNISKNIIKYKNVYKK